MSGRPGFWPAVRALLRAAATRASNRRRQAIALRRGRSAGNWGGVAFAFTVVALIGIHIIVAGTLIKVITTSAQLDPQPLERPLHVSTSFLADIKAFESFRGDHGILATEMRLLRPSIRAEAARIARERGGDADEIAELLETTLVAERSAGFTVDPSPPRLLVRHGRLADGALAIAGALWLLMLIGYGDEATFDAQARRHPMWEWLFSHPAPPAAVFLAESIAPIAANPIIFGAPLLPAILFGWAHGGPAGLLALFTVGIPVMLAAACAGRAIEFAIVLRLTPRRRSAALAMKHWLGLTAMAALFIVVNLGVEPALRTLAALNLAWAPPVLSTVLGLRPDGSAAPGTAMLTCLALSAAIVAASLLFTAWSAGRGLVAPGGQTRVKDRRRNSGFGRFPLLRKELLWLVRDRGAIVQIILLPLSMAGFNLFQFGHLAVAAPASWNQICGGGIVLGSLFLTYLGPRALASDGAALWIALSWPIALERMLRVKAALWTALTAMVTLSVFAVAVWRAPADAWRVALLVPVFLVFAWSVALKACTLATTLSVAGEQEPVPLARRWATQLGTFSFALGVEAGRWPQAVMGLVYSLIAAAALWEGFRARLPYLLDRWSERVPPPPTLTHALVAIGLLTDLAVVAAALIGLLGGVAAYVMAYAVSAAAVAIGMATFLDSRGVAFAEIRNWPLGSRQVWPALRAVCTGLAAGAALGMVALLYVSALPREGDGAPSLVIAYGILAVGVAPFCEEFLFRGLLYRALDRAWGGWRAVLGSAALFTVYHPVTDWPAVGALGLLNASLFRRSGRLEASVAAHLAYNAVVVGLASSHGG